MRPGASALACAAMLVASLLASATAPPAAGATPAAASGPAGPYDATAYFASDGRRIPLLRAENGSYSTPRGTPLAVGDRVAVRLAPDLSGIAELLERLAETHATLDEIVGEHPLRAVLHVVPTAARTAIDAANEIYESGIVEYAVPELYVPMELRDARTSAPRIVPNDPLFATQWPLENTGQGGRIVDADVDATEAWAYTQGSAEIIIAVLDDGVDVEHPDLAPNVSADGRHRSKVPPGPDARAADGRGSARDRRCGRRGGARRQRNRHRGHVSAFHHFADPRAWVLEPGHCRSIPLRGGARRCHHHEQLGLHARVAARRRRRRAGCNRRRRDERPRRAPARSSCSE